MTQDKTLLYLDDIYVGQRFASDGYAIDEEQIIAFAKQFDPQPFHLDAKAAQSSLFGGLVASGWHTASLTMRLLVTSSVPFASGLIGVEGQIHWPKPVRPGDVLRVESEILEIIPSQSHADRGIVAVRNETFNQKNETVQVMMAKLLVFRRSAAK